MPTSDEILQLISNWEQSANVLKVKLDQYTKPSEKHVHFAPLNDLQFHEQTRRAEMGHIISSPVQNEVSYSANTVDNTLDEIEAYINRATLQGVSSPHIKHEEVEPEPAVQPVVVEATPVAPVAPITRPKTPPPPVPVSPTLPQMPKIEFVKVNKHSLFMAKNALVVCFFGMNIYIKSIICTCTGSTGLKHDFVWRFKPGQQGTSLTLPFDTGYSLKLSIETIPGIVTFLEEVHYNDDFYPPKEPRFSSFSELFRNRSVEGPLTHALCFHGTYKECGSALKIYKAVQDIGLFWKKRKKCKPKGFNLLDRIESYIDDVRPLDLSESKDEFQGLPEKEEKIENVENVEDVEHDEDFSEYPISTHIVPQPAPEAPVPEPESIVLPVDEPTPLESVYNDEIDSSPMELSIDTMPDFDSFDAALNEAEKLAPAEDKEEKNLYVFLPNTAKRSMENLPITQTGFSIKFSDVKIDQSMCVSNSDLFSYYWSTGFYSDDDTPFDERMDMYHSPVFAQNGTGFQWEMSLPMTVSKFFLYRKPVNLSHSLIGVLDVAASVAELQHCEMSVLFSDDGTAVDADDIIATCNIAIEPLYNDAMVYDEPVEHPLELHNEHSVFSIHQNLIDVDSIFSNSPNPSIATATPTKPATPIAEAEDSDIDISSIDFQHMDSLPIESPDLPSFMEDPPTPPLKVVENVLFESEDEVEFDLKASVSDLKRALAELDLMTDRCNRRLDTGSWDDGKSDNEQPMEHSSEKNVKINSNPLPSFEAPSFRSIDDDISKLRVKLADTVITPPRQDEKSIINAKEKLHFSEQEDEFFAFEDDVRFLDKKIEEFRRLAFLD
ncbi:hypothetical protein PCE1_001013 [Barthelona sp. PCE]